jgi:hypothetical protein
MIPHHKVFPFFLIQSLPGWIQLFTLGCKYTPQISAKFFTVWSFNSNAISNSGEDNVSHQYNHVGAEGVDTCARVTFSSSEHTFHFTKYLQSMSIHTPTRKHSKIRLIMLNHSDPCRLQMSATRNRRLMAALGAGCARTLRPLGYTY